MQNVTGIIASASTAHSIHYLNDNVSRCVWPASVSADASGGRRCLAPVGLNAAADGDGDDDDGRRLSVD